MPNTESLVFDLLVRDRASSGLSDIGKAADGASRNTDALTNRLNELSRKSVEARVRLAGDKDALAALDKMDARLISLDRRVASPNMKVEGAARAVAEISAVDLELDKLGGKGGTAELATASVGTGGLAGPSGMVALIGAAVTLAPVVATVGTGLAGLAAGAYGTIAPILKASQATGGLAANLATLNPEQQLMARQLITLQGEASGFAKSLQPEVVKLWGDALGLAGGALHAVQPVAKATGDALHGVLGNINAELHTQQWTDFFNFMAQSAGPDIKLLGANVVDLVRVLPQLLTNLQPVATELLQATDASLKLVGGIEKLQTATVHLGDSSQHSSTFMKILSDSVKNAAVDMLPGLKALPILKTGLDHVTSSSVPAAGGIRAVAAAVVAAEPKVGTLSGDLAILGTTTSNSTVALQAYSDLWDIFVGKSVGDQQAVLNVTQAFEAFGKTVHQSGRTSTAAQQAFLSIFTTIGAGLEALHKNGASVSQLNGFYATSIARLNALHGLTPAQRQDVQGLTKDYLAWAHSVTGLSGNVVSAAGHIRQDFLTAMSLAHRLVPAARQDADSLAASILKTGTNSRATAGDRARLIADLVHSGLSAADARAQVKAFQDRISALRGKSVNVDLTTTGHGQIIITGTGINQRQINTTTGTLRGPGGHTAAAGWLLSGGTPGVDSIPLLGMPGELMVPKRLVDAGAVDHLRGKIPGFAAGGVVGRVSAAEGGIASADATWAAVAATAFAQAAVKAQQAALSGFLGPGGGNYAADIATVLSAMGLPLSLTANWLRQIQTESGGNLNAVNLTDSNARAGHPSVGLLQLIPATFAAYAGPYRNTPPLVNYGGGPVSLNPMAQIYAGIHYASARYDGSMASVIGHGHGYDSGGYLPPGLSLAWNGTGKPEPVGPAAATTYVINVQVMPGGEAEAGRVIVEKIRAFEQRSGKGWRS